jgi:adenosine deaminase
VKLCVFPDLARHNIGRLLDARLMATVNSDDPAYFGGYLNENFVQLFAATGMGAEQAYTLAANSFQASFVSQERRDAWVQQLQASFVRFAESDRVFDGSAAS